MTRITSALKVMLQWATEKPIKPYALAKAALAHVRKLYFLGAALERSGLLELDEVTLCGALLYLKEQIQDADKETVERWCQIGPRAVSAGTD